MIRTFIAIEIETKVKDDIAVWQSKLKKVADGVKWVDKNNIHITLKFLGNIEESQITDIKKAIEKSIEGIKSFEIEIKGEGCFPNINRPRVIWIGVERGKDILKEIAKNLENECEKLGFKKEKRPFSPHLTIGRVKRFMKSLTMLRKFLEENDFPAKKFTATEIVLMKSDLKPTGPVYTPIEKIKLG